MPILHPTVENPDELLAWPSTAGPVNRIQIERSTTGGGAGYANIGSVTVLAATRAYTYYDGDGLGSDWYRWYLSNAANTFPIAGQRGYSPEQQPGVDAGSGLLCDVADVKQALGIAATDTTEDENILERIGQVSTRIMGYTKRRFARSPASGTTTFLFEAPAGRILRVPQGIAEATQLEVATGSQPEVGGTYSIVTAADWFLRPLSGQRDYGWPATQIVISDLSASRIYAGYNAVRLTGALGWESVPPDIQGIAQRATIGGYLAKGSGQSGQAIVGPTGGMLVLRGISPEDQSTLDWYRDISVWIV